MVNHPLPQLLLASSVVLTTMAVTTSEILAQRVFQIHNTTGEDILELYVSSSSSQVWGLDYLNASRILSHSQSIGLELSGDCLYDIKARLGNGQQIQVNQVDTCTTNAVALGTDGIVVQPPKVDVAVNSPNLSRGFFCDTSTGIPETHYQGESGASEVWIRWGSDFFSSSGYDPLTRCRAVSGRLENYRRGGRLNYMGVGQMNGQNIICTAIQPGSCLGLIYTLKPQQDPVETLQQFMQHRKGAVGIAPLYESEDGADYTPFVDVRPFLAENRDSDTVPNSNLPQVNPQTPQPTQGGDLRDL